MAKLSVYVPDDLAEEAKRAELNVSALTQEALRKELDSRKAKEWWDEIRHRIETTEPTVTHEQVMAALDAARDEFGT